MVMSAAARPMIMVARTQFPQRTNIESHHNLFLSLAHGLNPTIVSALVKIKISISNPLILNDLGSKSAAPFAASPAATRVYVNYLRSTPPHTRQQKNRPIQSFPQYSFIISLLEKPDQQHNKHKYYQQQIPHRN